jgi:hypothetical protein
MSLVRKMPVLVVMSYPDPVLTLEIVIWPYIMLRITTQIGVASQSCSTMLNIILPFVVTGYQSHLSGGEVLFDDTLPRTDKASRPLTGETSPSYWRLDPSRGRRLYPVSQASRPLKGEVSPSLFLWILASIYFAFSSLHSMWVTKKEEWWSLSWSLKYKTWCYHLHSYREEEWWILNSDWMSSCSCSRWSIKIAKNIMISQE